MWTAKVSNEDIVRRVDQERVDLDHHSPQQNLTGLDTSQV